MNKFLCVLLATVFAFAPIYSVRADGPGKANQAIEQAFGGRVDAHPTAGQLLTWDDTNKKWVAADNGGVLTPTNFADGAFYISNSTDSSKRFKFDASSIAASTTRTITVPNLSGTLATTNGHQTFTDAIWNGTSVGAAYGGTGVSTIAKGDLLTSQATSTWAALGAGTSGYSLISAGAGANLAWGLPALLGTVTTGTWTATAVGAPYGGTGQTSYTTGDLLYASSSSAISKLGAGTSTYVLTAAGAGVAPAWAAIPTQTSALLASGTHTDTLTGSVVRGDVIIGNSTPKWARLAHGTANQVLTTDGTDVSWTTLSTGASSLAATLAVGNDANAIAITDASHTLLLGDSTNYLSYLIVGKGSSSATPTAVIIRSTNGSGAGVGADLTVAAGDGGSTNANGGAFVAISGYGGGSGTGGDATFGSAGGAPSGTGTGGITYVVSGDASTGATSSGGAFNLALGRSYGSNQAGAQATYKTGRSTGTGAGGSHVFQVTVPGSTGTALNSLATILTLSGNATKDATFTGNIIASSTGGTISCSNGNIGNEQFGASSTAAGGNASAFGNTASAAGADSVAIGYTSSTGGIQSVAIGSKAKADFGGGHTDSVVIGYNANTAANNTISLGSGTIAQAANSVEIGNATVYYTKLSFGDGSTASTSPHATTITFASPISATNGTGVSATLQAGASKGSGSGGSLIFQVTPAGAGGGGQNSYSTALTIASDLSATFAGAVTIAGKLTVTGAIDPPSVRLSSGTALFYESANGNTAGVSAANEGRIRYNSSTQTWQSSANGGAYASFSTGSTTYSNPGGGTNSEGFGSGVSTAGTSGTAFGNSASAGGTSSNAFGKSSSCVVAGIAIGTSSVIDTGAATNSINIGNSTTNAAVINGSVYSINVGSVSLGANNYNCKTFGCGHTLPATLHHGYFFGDSINATGTTSSVVGIGASQTIAGNASVCIGVSSVCAGTGSSTACGDTAYAFTNAVAFGAASNVTTANSTGIGYAANATGTTSTAVGASSTASATDAVVLGKGAVSAGATSTILGTRGNSNGFTRCVGLGTDVSITAANQFIVGATGCEISDGYFGNGVTNTSPTSFTQHGTGGSGTNIAGANYTIDAGRATGTASSYFAVTTGYILGSGTTAQTAYDREKITSKSFAGSTTSGTADTFCLLTNAVSVSSVGCTVDYTIEVSDGTAVSTIAGAMFVSASNRAGTVTATCSTATVSNQSVSDTTTFTALAATTTATVSGTNVQLKLTPSWAGGTPTSVTITYQVRANGRCAITPQ